SPRDDARVARRLGHGRTTLDEVDLDGLEDGDLGDRHVSGEEALRRRRRRVGARCASVRPSAAAASALLAGPRAPSGPTDAVATAAGGERDEEKGDVAGCAGGEHADRSAPSPRARLIT